MIESGLYQFLTTNGTIAALLGSPNAVYFSVLPKQPVLPAVRLFRVASPNASETLDLPTSGNQLIAGRFQFDSIAADSQQNPSNPSGYLSAAALSRAIRTQLLAQASLSLPDGTLLEDVRILDEFDADYEQGGTGYVYRRVLDIKIDFLEGSFSSYTPQFYEGDGAPTVDHNNEDVYYDLETGNLWEQVAGEWVQIGNIAPGGGTEVPSLIYHTDITTSGTQAVNIKNVAGTLTGWNAFNDTEFPFYVKVFDKATAPTLGTDIPRQTIPVQAGEPAVAPPGAGLTYVNGISIAVTLNPEDLDATGVAANAGIVDIFYQ